MVILVSSSQSSKSNLWELTGGMLLRKQNISEGLKSFIRDQLQTVPRLEVLILLHHRAKGLTSAEVAAELTFEKGIVDEELAALEALNLVNHSDEKEPRYEYQPANVALQSMVDQLVLSYSKQRVPILSIILSDCPDRLRLFRDAFKVIRGNG